MKASAARFILPLALFGSFIGLLAIGLKLDPSKVTSPLIESTIPQFSLPVLSDPQRHVTPQDLKGKVWLLNVWASWCASCRAEHANLIVLKKEGNQIVGLNYKDKDVAAKAWLKKWGDPYLMSIVDANGLVGVDFGVYGIPETFVIDANGIIRDKFIGAIISLADMKRIRASIYAAEHQREVGSASK